MPNPNEALYGSFVAQHKVAVDVSGGDVALDYPSVICVSVGGAISLTDAGGVTGIVTVPAGVYPVLVTAVQKVGTTATGLSALR